VPSKYAARRSSSFSPILADRSAIVCSTVVSPILAALSASTSAAFAAAAAATI
jgi:hypothetical protein